MSSFYDNNIEVAEEAGVVAKKLMDGFSPLIEDEKIIIIHSALSKLGFAKGSSYINGVLEFLSQLVQQGKTVLLPSFTFSFSKRKQYSYTDPSETGVLADLARKELRFHRTANPMFSFVLNGPQKNLFLNTRSDSGYGEGTAVSKLCTKDLAVVMLGAHWDCCTIIHAMEEQNKVPYRTYVEWNYPVDFGEGTKPHSFTTFVRDHHYKTQLRFDKIRDVLVQHQKLRQSTINNTTIEAANGKIIADLANQMILKDPFYFVSLENE